GSRLPIWLGRSWRSRHHLPVISTETPPFGGFSRARKPRSLVGEGDCSMAQPALDVFHQLDQALAAAVAAAAPSVIHVSRGHGGGTGIAWSTDLVITSSFHTPDRTKIGI